MTPIPTAEAFHAVMKQPQLLETAENIPAYKLPFAHNPDFTSSLLINFRKAADTVQIEIRPEFLEAIRELQSTISSIEGTVLTSSALTVPLSTIYPVEDVSTSEEYANLARPLTAGDLPTFSVNSDLPVSQSMQNPAALVATTSQDERYQRWSR